MELTATHKLLVSFFIIEILPPLNYNVNAECTIALANRPIMFQGVSHIMKKKDVVDLIRYHVDNNESGFIELAYDIATEFRESGDINLSSYIISLVSSKSNSFVPQSANFAISEFVTKMKESNTNVFTPAPILADIEGIVNAVGYHAGVNKFLFSGPPGTGKTETAKQLARILDRQLYYVNFELVIDSKLGQTQKNIASLFEEINRQSFPETLIILFDEIDALAMDRINSSDLREMGRATTALMKGLDELNEDIILLATTNMIKHFDKALLRRFDKIVDFSRYSKDDLIDIAEKLLDSDLKKFKFPLDNRRLCKKLFTIAPQLPYPGDLKNVIRTSIVFSNPESPTEYVGNIRKALCPDMKLDSGSLKELGFSLREMEVLTGVPKSTLARRVKGDIN